MLFVNTNKRITKTAIHALVWLFLFLFPYLLSSNDSNSSTNFLRIFEFSWFPMFGYMIVFYVNYLYLTDRFWFSKKMVWFVVINLCLISVCIWSTYEVRQLIGAINPPPPGRMPHGPKHPLRFFIYKDLISMLIPVVVSIATKTTERWARIEAEKKEREKENLNSELQNLRYQLQPHFFFNSLNNIYSLIERSPALAQETVHSLSNLMRYMLYDTDTGMVNLVDEIGFMRQYINLMKLRLSDKTTVHTDFPVLTVRYDIAPLLFVSLIENAFKHGVSATQPSELFFQLTVEGNTLRFMAVNHNFPKTNTDKSGSGIGLNNLRKRLELLYPGKYRFETQVEDARYNAVLEIDLS